MLTTFNHRRLFIKDSKLNYKWRQFRLKGKCFSFISLRNLENKVPYFLLIKILMQIKRNLTYKTEQIVKFINRIFNSAMKGNLTKR